MCEVWKSTGFSKELSENKSSIEISVISSQIGCVEKNAMTVLCMYFDYVMMQKIWWNTIVE